jgi:hypothetical protein
MLTGDVPEETRRKEHVAKFSKRKEEDNQDAIYEADACG